MKKHIFNVELKHTFGNLLRKQHVLIVCRNTSREVLLGYKPNFYPEGIYRLIGGGIDEGEDVLIAAQREIQEELGINVPTSEIKILYDVVVNACVNNDTHSFTTYLCSLNKPLDESTINPGDDIKGVKAFNLNELKDLIKKYESFGDDEWYNDVKGYKHLWQDYGKVYGPIHQLVLEEEKKRITSKDYDPNYKVQKQYFLVGGKAIIVNQKNEVLILQRSEKSGSGGEWSLPGGAVDKGEDAQDAIAREISEETQLSVHGIRPFTVRTHIKGEKDSAIIIGYTAHHTKGKVLLNWEHNDYRWLDVKEALTYDLTPDGQYFLKTYLKSLV